MTELSKTSRRLATWLSVAFFLATMAACTLGSRLRPNLAAPPVGAIRLQPDRAWTDTSVMVQEGEELFFTANGDITWAAQSKAAGPDGLNGYPGWNIGAGGLIGRVGVMKSFDIGARTQMFLNKGSLRHHVYFAPPPIRMPASGRLELGFKDFKQGTNTGEFAVTIRRAQ